MCLTQIAENIIWKMKMENFDIEESNSLIGINTSVTGKYLIETYMNKTLNW